MATPISMRYVLCLCCFCMILPAPSLHAQQLHPKREYAATLVELSKALLARQMKEPSDPNCGGIWCEHCHVWHTRAAESVFPFTIAWSVTSDEKYLDAAKNAVAWLIRQQQPNGSWKETPEEWTGTTTDQLLMMLLSYEKLSGRLDEKEKTAWRASMQHAAAYLYDVMDPEFASINYVATTTATLAKAGQMFDNKDWLQKAAALAHRTISKMDPDGFLDGEGGRSHRNKMGVDLGYDMEMSLWGLGLYARLTHDTLVHDRVSRALRNHLSFIYPDGSLDASWGIRSNKWTGYGSATSDGCQVLFTLFADEDPRYAAASLRNLSFLRQCTYKDLIGFGPQHASVFGAPPCIYPTFAKAKNLAMAYAFETKETRPAASLPCDSPGVKVFPTLDVVEVRTRNFMATITGYRYKDPAGTKGKYMYRADGGAMSHCWLKGLGFLQASSPTEYTRPEPMSFPEAPGVRCLTPRIEYRDTTGYFTNLYEYDSRINTDTAYGQYHVGVRGELKDKHFLTGGVGYGIDYLFNDYEYEKDITLTFHDSNPDTIDIIEPFVRNDEMTVERMGSHILLLRYGKIKLRFSLLSDNAELITGRDETHFWTPYPALKAFPIMLHVHRPTIGSEAVIRYRITLLQ